MGRGWHPLGTFVGKSSAANQAEKACRHAISLFAGGS
ncbi:hypothetical protein CGRA01v4_13484 [Colletotrichum graminicola]|nr:hypothetical protein CGRA01v4_13484 [Colletotrichum graminicola]